MKATFKILGLSAILFASLASARAEDGGVPDRVLGNPNAPVRVDEFVSFTCSHCADFYNNVLPELETKYVDTNKVKFVLHDYVMDGLGLKAALLARCMPAEQFYPFIQILYKNQATWIAAQEPEKVLMGYARLGGLPDEKAQACLNDTKMQDAIIAEREGIGKKYDVQATPTFVINNGAKEIKGASPAKDFAAIFDPLLAGKN